MAYWYYDNGKRNLTIVNENIYLAQSTFTNPSDNLTYHIVRGCIPTNIPLKECGKDSLNL